VPPRSCSKLVKVRPFWLSEPASTEVIDQLLLWGRSAYRRRRRH
jgi:hypothetical protein